MPSLCSASLAVIDVTHSPDRDQTTSINPSKRCLVIQLGPHKARADFNRRLCRSEGVVSGCPYEMELPHELLECRRHRSLNTYDHLVEYLKYNTSTTVNIHSCLLLDLKTPTCEGQARGADFRPTSKVYMYLSRINNVVY